MRMLALLIVSFLFIATFNLENGLGKTPAMGWSSWNKFGCTVNENDVKRNADLLVSTGLASKGYTYLNIDDCWQV